MTQQFIKEFDVSTGLEIEREMNAEELAQWEADKAAVEAKFAAEAQAATEAAAAKAALLAKLGITEEEAKLLLS